MLKDLSYLLRRRSATQNAHPVRRVFLSDKGFVCGVCLEVKPAQGAALECLRRCVANELKHQPVGIQSKQSHISFGCNLCQKTYLTELLAEMCAERCCLAFGVTPYKRHKNVNAQLPQKAGNPIVLNTPASHLKLASNTTQQTQNKQTKQQLLKKQNDPGNSVVLLAAQERIVDPIKSEKASKDVLSLIERFTKRSKNAMESFGGEAPAVTLDTASLSKLGDSGLAFVRINAAYQCRGCSKKYFTRDDVEKCFASDQKNLPKAN